MDAREARDAGMLPAAAYERLQPFFETGDFSAVPEGALNLSLGALLRDANHDEGEFRVLGASKVIAQTMGGTLGPQAVQRVVSATLRNRPASLARVLPAEAGAAEFSNDLDSLIPDAAIVTVPPLEGQTEDVYVRLGIYLSSSEQMMDQPALVLDSWTKHYLEDFYARYEALATDAQSRDLLARFRASLAATRTNDDVARLALFRHHVPEIARKIVPEARLAAFGFGLAVAQGAYNAAALQDPKEAYRWMTYVKGYAGLDGRSASIAGLRHALSGTSDGDFAAQNRIFAALTHEALAIVTAQAP